MSLLEKWLTHSILLLAGISVTVVTIVTFSQVLTRFVFNFSIPWSTDVTRIAFILMVFIVMPVLIKKDEHIKVDILAAILPPRVMKIFDIISIVFVLLVLILIFYSSVILTMNSNTQYMPFLTIKMSHVYSILPICSAVSIFYTLKNLYQSLRIIFKEGGN